MSETAWASHGMVREAACLPMETLGEGHMAETFPVTTVSGLGVSNQTTDFTDYGSRPMPIYGWPGSPRAGWGGGVNHIAMYLVQASLVQELPIGEMGPLFDPLP